VVIAAATIGAPVVGGLVTEHLGWRWCFFLGVPFAVVAVTMVQMVLHLPPHRAGRRQIDWIGATLIAGGLTMILLWISLSGPRTGFWSLDSVALLAAGLAMLGVAAWHEVRTPHAILPIALLRQRALVLCALGGAATGIALFGTSVFITLYLQLGRGLEPSAAGAMALPEAAGAVLGAVTGSRLVASTGHIRGPIVAGAAMMCLGFALLASVGIGTPLAMIAASVALVGCGLGLASENLTLVVQTSVARESVGMAGAIVSFARMLGGILCVAALGSLLSWHVGGVMAAAGAPPTDGKLPDPALLSPALRGVFAQAYSDGAAMVYLACLPAAVLLLVCALLLPARRIPQE
jgi:predicted MFS family arabinose efflux permease